MSLTLKQWKLKERKKEKAVGEVPKGASRVFIHWTQNSILKQDHIPQLQILNLQQWQQKKKKKKKEEKSSCY